VIAYTPTALSARGGGRFSDARQLAEGLGPARRLACDRSSSDRFSWVIRWSTKCISRSAPPAGTVNPANLPHRQPLIRIAFRCADVSHRMNRLAACRY
jgi:hypothetical protein